MIRRHILCKTEGSHHITIRDNEVMQARVASDRKPLPHQIILRCHRTQRVIGIMAFQEGDRRSKKQEIKIWKQVKLDDIYCYLFFLKQVCKNSYTTVVSSTEGWWHELPVQTFWVELSSAVWSPRASPHMSALPDWGTGMPLAGTHNAMSCAWAA